jgi:ribosomal protein S18 acetylase RimI-like enzyme
MRAAPAPAAGVDLPAPIGDDRPVAVELRPAAELSMAALADLFTAAYDGYLVPFAVDEATLAYMVDAFDLDLDGSLVAVDGRTPVGLANLGRRGEAAWIGGIGVVPDRRRKGIGERLMRGVVGGAREAGARVLTLEVIVGNDRARALYEKLGFVTTRELEILSLAGQGGGGEAEPLPLDAARRLIAARRDGAEPWQRADETLDNLARRDPLLQALVSGDAAAIFRVSEGRVGLLQAAGSGSGLHRLAAALRCFGTVAAANYPAQGPVAAVLREAGAEVTLRQFEMALAL